MQRKDSLVEPDMSGDDGGAIVVGQSVVAQLEYGARIKGMDGFSGRAADVDAHVNVADAFKLIAQIHPWPNFIVFSDSIRVFESSIGVVAVGEVIDFVQFTKIYVYLSQYLSHRSSQHL